MRDNEKLFDVCWVVDRRDGIGHAVRCTTISQELTDQGASVCPGGTDDCPRHARVVVVDSKVFPRPLTTTLKETSIPVVVLDNLRTPSLSRYDLHIFPHPYVPRSITSTKLLSGCEYITIHPLIPTINPNTQHGRNLILSMGGADPHKFTISVLGRLRELDYRRGVNVLFGKRFRGVNKVIGALRPGGTSFTYHHHFYLDDAHAAIVGFGLTFYEMVYLGIPAMCLTNSNPDTQFVHDMADHLGYGKVAPWWAGGPGELAPPEQWRTWMNDPAGQSLELPTLDKNGAERCAAAILAFAV